MIVCHARRFIFFHNPKCAGMSFREALQPYHDDPFSFWGIYSAPYFQNHLDHSHLRLWETHALFPRILDCAQTYNSVIFVRSPYARFLAALNEHFKKFQPRIDLAAMTSDQRVAIMERFVSTVLTIARITTDWRFVHFSPQIWLSVLAGRVVPRHIIPMDETGAFTHTALSLLGLPVTEVPWRNKSPVDLSAVLESTTIKTFINTFYAADFAFFDERPALAQVARRI